MKPGQVFLASGQDFESIKALKEYGWLQEEVIEGVGTVYTLTKEGFHWLCEEYWRGHA